MGNLLGDFRYALRSLARQPTFAAVAILTLVLGIGTNTAIFSVIKAVLLNQLPYQDPSRLVVLSEQNPDGNTDLVAPLTFMDWKAQSRAVPSMAAFRQLRYAFAGSAEPLNVPSVRATPNLFSVLGVNALVGRTFVPEEGVPGADKVAVLSRAFWERHFGGSASAIGRKIQLDAVPYTIVGVMPAEFDFPPSGNVDVWTPLSFDPNDGHGRSRKARSLNVVGRLADGVSHEQAQRDMTLVAGAPRDDVPGQQHGLGRAGDRGAGTARHHRPAGAADDLRGRRLPAADRLRERREPDPGQALEPARRDRGPRGARRGARAARAPGAGGKLRAVGDRRRAGASRRLDRRPPRPRAARRQPAAHAGRAARRRRAAVRARRLGAGRARLRSRAGAPGVARGPARHDERLLRRDPQLRRPPAQRARRGRGRAGADAAGRRRVDDAELRAVDARVARLRAGQPAGGPDLPAAGEVPDRRSIARAST